ncbi:DUF998 domain-containing protein [Thermoactinospora rubra]|uniref:DUF998 domain-containing protein n=1 Tax=Thermoactinospora rubra TaxID=1088767 RepID=UPI001F0A186B|nr:DUF998 domain-containing protein [Thermoactinospora rubra]
MVQRFSPLVVVACLAYVVIDLALTEDWTDRAIAPGTLVVMGVAALALTAGMRAADAPVRGLPQRLLLGSGAALVAAGLVPHAEVAALVGLPAAAALLVPRLAGQERWQAVARPVEWMTLVAGFGLLAMTYVALPGDRVMLGLVERLLLVAEAGLLAVLAAGLAQVAWPQMTRFLSIS